MDDLLMAAPPSKAKKKKAVKRSKKSDSPATGHAGVHVHVNVVNSTAHGDSKGKRSNEADDALSRLRGY